MWKILTREIRNKIYDSLLSYGLFSKERRGCRKGTGDLQYINQDILKNSKTRRKNLAIVWIDYKMAYDMVAQSCLKMYKISGEVINFLKNAMENWKVKLTAGGKSLNRVKIQSSVF